MSLKNQKILVDQKERDGASTPRPVNVLVEAGAGTGKTTLLIARFLNILKLGLAKIDEIVAITFTHKATAEMVTRLRDALETEILDSGLASEEKGNLKQALLNFNNHRISTIHGLCGAILKEFPIEARVDPAFGVLEERDEKELVDELWENWLKKQVEKRESVINQVYELGIGNDYLKIYLKFIMENLDFFSSYDFSLNYDLEDLARSFGEIVESMVDLKKKYAPEVSPGVAAEAILNYQLDWIQIKKLPVAEQVRRIFLYKINRAQMKGSWGEDAKEIYSALRDRLKEVTTTEIFRWIANKTGQLLLGVLGQVEDRKLELQMITHDDYLLKTRDLLRDYHRVREYYKGKFRQILIDEFQDTDPLQTEIAFFLAEEPGKCERDWKECRLVPGKLFLVGDPKQSIYGFRRADIEIYEEAKALFQEKNDILNIRVNFRTQNPLIDWINLQFSRAIKKDGTNNRFQPNYTDLEVGRQGVSKQGLVLLEAEQENRGDFTIVGPVRELEAQVVATYIRELIDSKAEIELKNGKKKIISYSDIAILFPNYTEIENLYQALEERDVPFVLEKGRFFFTRQEIQETLKILRAIDNPSDETAVVGTLKTPFFGASDEDLLQFSFTGAKFNYLTPGNPSHNLEAQFEVLRRIYQQKNSLSVYSLLDTVFDELMMREFFTAVYEEKRGPANLEKLLSMAYSFDEKGGGTLTDFINELEEKIRNQEREPDAPLNESESDVVNLLTFH
ncbi:MAG: UvrD-helicase domain-containing protein, partial [Vulcanimicrobiota bacterium]